jgi:hypothetical protein
MFVPFSLWPIDVRGLGLHVLSAIEAGAEVDSQARLMAELLPEAPPDTVCDPIAEYEQAVSAGSYESLINAQFKFDSMEAALRENAEFKKDWESLKRAFPVDNYRNAKGIIRRRRVQERNFRGGDWKFSWKTETERFQNVFDAFCHRWNLYGMQGELKTSNFNPQTSGKAQTSNSKGDARGQWVDKPLLLKLSVNLTPFSTMIEVPRYWSFDPKRDLKWGAVTKLHRMREVPRQGPKLSPGKSARREETSRAKELWREATKAGLRGDRRVQWVMGRLGWDARTDESKLRRLIRGNAE